jgi:aconitate hydratase
VIPPASGIVHQVNLEYLSPVAQVKETDGQAWVYPDSVFGTDSHTPMVSGMGVLAWGVGGIEAAAAMLGQPVETAVPDVIGVHVSGNLSEGCTPTDAVLTLTHLLRGVGVVDKIVEFYGPGLAALSVPDRAMLANMAPEYGATTGYFPVDEQVINYLRVTGRDEHHIRLMEAYFKSQGLYRESTAPIPEYTATVEFDLAKVVPSLAGPRRPQDLVLLSEAAASFKQQLQAPVGQPGYGISADDLFLPADSENLSKQPTLRHGSVILAAITSCTNTSNPSALVYAGLLARKAAALGLRPRSFVKTSFAPGSRAVVRYLEEADLLEPLETLGFHVVGYGCTTCIGNSGPLAAEIERSVRENQLVAAAVISGNRNFEGRVHPLIQANYLASPALVIAYALAGNIAVDLLTSPLGYAQDGQPVFLRDIWPNQQEVEEVTRQALRQDIFSDSYTHIDQGDATWKNIPSSSDELYPWNPESTYIRESPFAELNPARLGSSDLRVLAVLGDSITTDHISPAGFIARDSSAGEYLVSRGVALADFNTYGSRRGNHEVMARAAFANPRLKNALAAGVEGPFTRHMPDGESMRLFDAAQRYLADGIGTVILAGKEYGTGSSRDWAAKGPLLLGVQAVIARSFERIHRSNLVGMGILPLCFENGESAISLGLDGSELLNIQGLKQIQPNGKLSVIAAKPSGSQIKFSAKVMLKSPAELDLWWAGGILSKYMQEMANLV